MASSSFFRPPPPPPPPPRPPPPPPSPWAPHTQAQYGLYPLLWASHSQAQYGLDPLPRLFFILMFIYGFNIFLFFITKWRLRPRRRRFVNKCWKIVLWFVIAFMFNETVPPAPKTPFRHKDILNNQKKQNGAFGAEGGIPKTKWNLEHMILR